MSTFPSYFLLPSSYSLFPSERQIPIMAMYSLEKLRQLWKQEELTVEQMLGQLLQHLETMQEQLQTLQKEVRTLQRGRKA